MALLYELTLLQLRMICSSACSYIDISQKQRDVMHISVKVVLILYQDNLLSNNLFQQPGLVYFQNITQKPHGRHLERNVCGCIIYKHILSPLILSSSV